MIDGVGLHKGRFMECIFPRKWEVALEQRASGAGRGALSSVYGGEMSRLDQSRDIFSSFLEKIIL